MMRANPMQMAWCLGCHTNPAPNLSPPSDIFAPLPVKNDGHGSDPVAAHDALMQRYGIDPKAMTDCYVCHR
jgi:hypothetical protein